MVHPGWLSGFKGNLYVTWSLVVVIGEISGKRQRIDSIFKKMSYSLPVGTSFV